MLEFPIKTVYNLTLQVPGYEVYICSEWNYCAAEIYITINSISYKEILISKLASGGNSC
jgi:hypothetical protein